MSEPLRDALAEYVTTRKIDFALYRDDPVYRAVVYIITQHEWDRCDECGDLTPPDDMTDGRCAPCSDAHEFAIDAGLVRP